MSRRSENRARPDRPANARGGFSLIELLIVVVVLGIVTGAVLTNLQSTVNDQLDAAARVVVSDLNYVRNLSVSNNTSYRFTLIPGTSRYYFEHSGGNTALDTLPASPHGGTSESPTQQSTDISLFSMNSASIELAAVHVLTPTATNVTDLEFGPLGETTRSEETIIWLAAGSGDTKRFLWLAVNPVTGNTRIGEHTIALSYGDEGGGLEPTPDPEPYEEPSLPDLPP